MYLYQMYIDKKDNRKPPADITRKKLTEESMKAFSPSWNQAYLSCGNTNLMCFPLLQKIRGFLYAKSLQDESVFSTKSFEVSLEAFLRKGEAIRVSLKLWRFSVVIVEILSLFSKQPKITWETITGHRKTLGQWQEVKEMP